MPGAGRAAVYPAGTVPPRGPEKGAPTAAVCREARRSPPPIARPRLLSPSSSHLVSRGSNGPLLQSRLPPEKRGRHPGSSAPQF